MYYILIFGFEHVEVILPFKFISCQTAHDILFKAIPRNDCSLREEMTPYIRLAVLGHYETITVPPCHIISREFK